MDMTDKEFVVTSTDKIEGELQNGIIAVQDQFKVLDNKIDVEITLAKEEIDKRIDNMLDIEDMLNTQKVLMRYLDNVSMTAFLLLIVSCIAIIICIISDHLNNYSFLKICLPLFAGCVIGCLNHICQTAKKLSIEIFRLSEFLKRRKTK